MSFLNAEWRKLALANYEIDPEVLKPHVPYKTELDLWQGRCYVSLVGFMFLNTRLLGMSIPFHRNFEEVNLRFYVRHQAEGEWKRGVVFVKEIVPKPALTFVANTVYQEHYQTMKMDHAWEQEGELLNVTYGWKTKGQRHHLSLKAQTPSIAMDVGSEAEFITEHYWGYTQINPQKTFEYQVTHPRWEVYPVQAYDIKADFGALYGEEFGILNRAEPISVMLAEGSEITVENKRRIH